MMNGGGGREKKDGREGEDGDQFKYFHEQKNIFVFFMCILLS